MTETGKAFLKGATSSKTGSLSTQAGAMRPFLSRFAAAMLMFGVSGVIPTLATAQTGNATVVKAGVDAWSAGDYGSAVDIWRGPAEAGDADAQFNLAQAYRLGRGVPADIMIAERYYAQAAAQGHIQAADNYGLLMFQDGRREAALPYVQAAADRGDPRAQYLLGIAHFNGDLVPRDWVRAYALLTNANAAGLPQATSAIAQMDRYIPLEQRQQAQIVADQLREASDSRRNVQFAAFDLALGHGSSEAIVPLPAGSATAAPNVEEARRAVALAAGATGLQSPAQAGADAIRATATQSAPEVLTAGTVPETVPVRDIPPTAPPPSITLPDPAAEAATVPAREGPWRVQLGAFSVNGNAEKLWDRLSSRPELAGTEQILIASGRLTRLLAGGFATRAEAAAACAALKRAGHDCLVTR